MTQPNFTLEEWNIIGCSMYDGIESVSKCSKAVRTIALPKYEEVLKKVKRIIDELKQEQS